KIQSCKFTAQDPGPADRMGKKKFCCMSLFLFRQHRNPAHGSVKSTSKSKDIAAFNSVETGQGAEADLVHSEGSTEIPHGRKNITDLIHLTLHLRKQEDAYCEEKSDGYSPYDQA